MESPVEEMENTQPLGASTGGAPWALAVTGKKAEKVFF